MGVPAALETTISGESLFNDGVGVVLFILLIEFLRGGDISPATVATLVALEVIGGLAYGTILGWVVFRMLRAVDNYEVEILLTLALVTGGYALAHTLHVSGPLAMVVAGVLIEGRGRRLAMSETARARLDEFWELVDEFLNAVLFVLIGLEVMDRRALRPGRPGRRGGRPPGPPGPPDVGGATRVVAAQRALPASGRRRDPDLGWTAGRHLGCVRALAAGEPVPRPADHDHLNHRLLLDHRAGPDRGPRRHALQADRAVPDVA